MTFRKLLFIVLLLGLLLRVGLLIFYWSEPLTIVDEMHYQRIAQNILENHEFSYRTGQPTAFRPPLYPIFLSVIYFITGGVYLNAVRIVQIILSLGIIVVLYLLGKTIFDKKTALLASFIFAVYPSFLFFTHLLLTEVLFTFFLLLFLYYFVQFLNISPTIAGKKNFYILLAGIFLGLGALTRSILYPFLFVTILFIFVACRNMVMEKIKWACLLSIGFILVVSPWVIRNYMLFKDLVIVDTMGGLNLYLGNYEHTPLNRAWAAVDLTGDKKWSYGHEKELSGMNEAQKQRWATDNAKEFIINNKWLTLKRDLVKGASFWGLEREVIGPIIAGYWPRLNKTLYLVIITFFIFSTYCFVLLCSVFGVLFHLKYENKNVLICAVLVLFFALIHTIVFGHSRYHLPLMPVLGIFASWFLVNMKTIWEKRRHLRQIVATLIVMILVTIWVREIIFVEGARFLKNL